MERRGVVPGTPGDCGTVGPSERQCQGACCFPHSCALLPSNSPEGPCPISEPSPLNVFWAACPQALGSATVSEGHRGAQSPTIAYRVLGGIQTSAEPLGMRRGVGNGPPRPGLVWSLSQAPPPNSRPTPVHF